MSTAHILLHNIYLLMPAVMIGKWIPGRITNPLTRLYPVVAPRGQADISRGRSTPNAPAPCDNHIPTPALYPVVMGSADVNMHRL